MTASPMKLEGYAVVFESPAQVGNNTEKILREALTNCDMSETCLIYNHDLSKVPLARVPDTLTLEVDNRGLKFSAIIPDTEEGRAVYESVKRGDLRGCSFAFTIAANGESYSGNQRTISKIDKIFELSICPFPAYNETTVQARNINLEAKTMTTTETQNQNQFGENAQSLIRNVAGLDTIESAVKFTADNVLETAEYRTGFYKTLQGKELTQPEQAAVKTARVEFEKRNNEFNTSTNSAAVIPTATLDEIISKARTQGGLIAECRGFSIPSNVSIPIATPKEKAAWHTEGAAVDTEKIETTSVTFSANEIVKIFSMSLKTQAMTISAFESYLTTELENCVMETIETALIDGTGSGQGTGIMSVFDSDNTIAHTSVINSEVAVVGLDYKTLLQSIEKLPSAYRKNAKFAMNSTTLWRWIYSLVDGNQRPLFIQDLQNDTVGKLLGFPIVIDDNIATGNIIFGDFKYMSYNLPQGIVIESSRESSFKSGLIDYRAICIADCKPLLKEAFVLIAHNETTYNSIFS